MLFFAFDLDNSFIVNELLYYEKEGIKITVVTKNKIPNELKNCNNLTFFNLKEGIISKRKLVIDNFFLILKLVFIELKQVFKNTLYIKLFKHELMILLSQLDYALQVKEYCKNMNETPQLYAYWFHDEAIVCSFLVELKVAKMYVSRAHAFDIYEEERQYGIMPYVHFKLKNAKRILTVSQMGANYFIQKYPQYRSKFIVSYLGTSKRDEALNPVNLSNKIKIVSCGSIQFRKRINLIYNVLKQVPNVEWTHIGDGPQKELFFQNISIDTPIKVNFLGNLKNEDVKKIYSENAFDFFISLSENEGIPVSIMEAISYGIPVISTNAGGCSEIINKKTGVLIPVNFNENELVQMITNIKNTDFNTVEKRKMIAQFWQANFYATTNYKNFLNTINAIS